MSLKQKVYSIFALPYTSRYRIEYTENKTEFVKELI